MNAKPKKTFFSSNEFGRNSNVSLCIEAFDTLVCYRFSVDVFKNNSEERDSNIALIFRGMGLLFLVYKCLLFFRRGFINILQT